jgi:hypothetical protein
MNWNMICGDCEHLRDNGTCPRLEEVLRSGLFPECACSPILGADTSAETCPDFLRSDASRDGERMTPWEDGVDRAYKDKVEGRI